MGYRILKIFAIVLTGMLGLFLLGFGAVTGSTSMLALGNAALLLVVIALLAQVWRNGIQLYRHGEQAGGQLIALETGVKDIKRRAVRLQDGVGTLRARARRSQDLAARSRPVAPASVVREAGGRPPALRFSTLDYWSRRQTMTSSLEWTTRVMVKHRSEDGRDTLAYAATRGELDYLQLSQSLAVYRSHKNGWHHQGAPLSLVPAPSVALARVLYRQRLRLVDLQDSISIYESLIASNCQHLKPVDHGYLVDALTIMGRREDAARHLATRSVELDKFGVASYLNANILNPRSRKTQETERWLEAFNAVLTSNGLEPVTLDEGDGPPFYRMRCHVTDTVNDGPLVSVLMPVFEANDATDLAITSILGQSWRNLELIIVDDGSDEEYRERLRTWEGRDPRLRIIFNPVNRGAYWARNTAYAAASGEFVTVADKDDWHHPRKIEIQARDMLEDPAKIGNMTSWVRVDEWLRFLVRWGPMRIAHPSFASIFFRRETVMAKLGFWDNVRKSGDGEFKGRIKAVFGVDLQPMSQVPLAISLLEDSNLTSNDLGLGFEHPNRTVYRKTYEHWHKGFKSGRSPYLEMDPERRPFPAPREFLPERPTYAPFDVIFVSEFGFEGGSSRVLENEIATCIEAGLRVGVVLMENMLIREASERNASWYMHRLILDGKVTRLALTDVAQAQLLLIRWPAILQMRPGLTSGIRAQHALVIANHAPYENGNRRYSYDPPRVSDNVRRIFDMDPLWAPESARIRELLVPLLPDASMYPMDWPGVLPRVPDRPQPRERPLAEKPVIGRHSRDAILKWPQKDALRQVYPTDGEFHVRILGGIDSILKEDVIKEEEAASWMVHQFGAVDPPDFLREIDFFVYYHHPDLVESYGMVVVEAILSGAVVVLPPHFEPVFEDAAVYANAEDARAAIWRLWSDWDEYQRQADRAHRYLRENVSPTAFLERLRALGVDVAAKVQAATAVA